MNTIDLPMNVTYPSSVCDVRFEAPIQLNQKSSTTPCPGFNVVQRSVMFLWDAASMGVGSNPSDLIQITVNDVTTPISIECELVMHPFYPTNSILDGDIPAYNDYSIVVPLTFIIKEVCPSPPHPDLRILYSAGKTDYEVTQHQSSNLWIPINEFRITKLGCQSL